MAPLIEYKPIDSDLEYPQRYYKKEEDEKSENTTASSASTTSTEIPSVTSKIDWADRIRSYRASQLPEYPVTTQDTQATQITQPKVGPEEYERAWEEYLQRDPDAINYKQQLTDLASFESEFRSRPSAGDKGTDRAYGYFQVMGDNIKNISGGQTSIDQFMADPVKQIEIAVKLWKSQAAGFKDRDYSRAKELGWSEDDVRKAGWFAGVGGTRNYLHRGINPNDYKMYGGKDKGGVTLTEYVQRVTSSKQGGNLDKDYKHIKIRNKKYYIEIAESEEEKSIGLSDRESLPENEGMLFIIKDDEKDEKDLIWFTMEDTSFPLDIIFIDDDLEVTQVSKGKPMSTEPIYGEGDYVLELNINSGVKVGDEIEFVTDKEVNKKMLVLDSSGEVQMKLEGGERIMSINNTKTLIKFAKKASSTGKDNDYKTLGKRVFKFLETQNNAEPEYV